MHGVVVQEMVQYVNIVWIGLKVRFKENKNKTNKKIYNKSIGKRGGRDQRNKGGRERTVVITTKLGVSASSRMLRG